MLLIAGCSTKGPEGYGVFSRNNTAAQAQQQLQDAEKATQPDNLQTHLDLIAQMQRAGQWYASLAHVEAFELEHGGHIEAGLLRADALRNIGKQQAAEKAYGALLNGPLAARARRGLGLLHASQENYAQAARELEIARQLNPIDADVLSDLAYAHMRNGQMTEAQVPMLQAAQLAPDDRRIQLNMAMFWLAIGQSAKAKSIFQHIARPSKGGIESVDISTDTATMESLNTQLAAVLKAVRSRESPHVLDGERGAAQEDVHVVAGDAGSPKE
jgi:Flp pilus assembly protein TadD